MSLPTSSTSNSNNNNKKKNNSSPYLQCKYKGIMIGFSCYACRGMKFFFEPLKHHSVQGCLAKCEECYHFHIAFIFDFSKKALIVNISCNKCYHHGNKLMYDFSSNSVAIDSEFIFKCCNNKVQLSCFLSEEDIQEEKEKMISNINNKYLINLKIDRNIRKKDHVPQNVIDIYKRKNYTLFIVIWFKDEDVYIPALVNPRFTFFKIMDELVEENKDIIKKFTDNNYKVITDNSFNVSLNLTPEEIKLQDNDKVIILRLD